MFYTGDCLDILKNLGNETVDLVYMDPPFFTQKRQKLKTRDNTKEYCFDDKWDSINEYYQFIGERLKECRRVLKNSGSIFVHCDRSASHHLRMSLDDVFGSDQFQSEIVWIYKRWSNNKKGLLNAHQIIYFYAKFPDFKFYPIYEGYSPTTNIDQIFQKRIRDKNGKTVYKKDINGDCELLEDKRGVPLSDVWEIPYLNPKAKERTGYPTQKPILLLERIIQLVTDKGDLVLDPFCGSGTTLVAAELLKREFIGIDISKDAIAICKERVRAPIRTESFLLQKGKSAYVNQSHEINKLLEIIGAVPVQRNKGIDGFLKYGDIVKPIPVKIQRSNESLEEAEKLLVKASQKNKYKGKILIKTNNKHDNNLFDIIGDSSHEVLIVEDIERFLSEKEAILNHFG
ncbi:MAG: site-specific DNA-methyltransferase [Candidatus Omnitrophota bacterium]